MVNQINAENAADSKAKQIIKNIHKFNPDNFRFSEELRKEFLSKHTKNCSHSFLWTYNVFSEVFFDLYERLASLSIYKYNLEILRIECAKIAISDSLNVVDRAKRRSPQLDKDNTFVMADRPFIGLSDGNNYSPDDIYGGLFDSLKSMYDYIGYVESNFSEGMEIPDKKSILEFFRLTNKYIIAKNDWQEALWHREHVVPLDEEILDNPLRHLRAIALYRSMLAGAQGETFQENRVKFTHPPILLDQKSVLKKLKIRKFVGGQLVSIRETAYGQKIGDELFIKYGNVNLHELLEAYFYLEAICRSNVEEVISKNLDYKYFDYFVSSFESIVNYLVVMTGWDASKVVEVVNFMKFKEGSREEIWYQPLLVRKEKVILLFPIFMYGNVERLISHLCVKLGVDVAKFGRALERSARTKIAQQAEKSSLSSVFRLLNLSHFEISGIKEEIDLCFIINNCLFVAEIKSDFFAADAISFGDHVAKVEDAASQVIRKAKFIGKNLMDFVGRFCRDCQVNSVYPFILVDQRHLSGALINGCPVIDLLSLTKFFDRRLPFRVIQRPSGSVQVGKFVETYTSVDSSHNDLQKYMVENPFVNEIGLYAVTRPLPRSSEVFKVPYQRADIRIDPRLDTK